MMITFQHLMILSLEEDQNPNYVIDNLSIIGTIDENVQKCL